MGAVDDLRPPRTRVTRLSASLRPPDGNASVDPDLTRAAMDRGLLIYPSTGCVDGERGDLVMLGPPFVITDAEMAEAVDRLVAAIEGVL